MMTADMPLGRMNHHPDWRMAQRFIVWLLFMASGVVMIPLGVVMCIAYFPGGVPVLLAWLDWAGSVHTWMLGRTSFLGEPRSLSSHPVQPEGIDPVRSGNDMSSLTHSHSRVCPACGYECVSASGTPKQCPSCTYPFDIERKASNVVAHAIST
jgi:hypothetical protein